MPTQSHWYARPRFTRKADGSLRRDVRAVRGLTERQFIAEIKRLIRAHPEVDWQRLIRALE